MAKEEADSAYRCWRSATAVDKPDSGTSYPPVYCVPVTPTRGAEGVILVLTNDHSGAVGDEMQRAEAILLDVGVGATASACEPSSPSPKNWSDQVNTSPDDGGPFAGVLLPQRRNVIAIFMSK